MPLGVEYNRQNDKIKVEIPYKGFPSSPPYLCGPTFWLCSHLLAPQRVWRYLKKIVVMDKLWYTMAFEVAVYVYGNYTITFLLDSFLFVQMKKKKLPKIH